MQEIKPGVLFVQAGTPENELTFSYFYTEDEKVSNSLMELALQKTMKNILNDIVNFLIAMKKIIKKINVEFIEDKSSLEEGKKIKTFMLKIISDCTRDELWAKKDSDEFRKLWARIGD